MTPLPVQITTGSGPGRAPGGPEAAGGWTAGTWMRRPAKLVGRAVGVEVEVLSETACWARTAPPASSTRTCAAGKGTWAATPAATDSGSAPWRSMEAAAAPALPAASRRRCSRAWVR